MEKVGFLGLGNMGKLMALNLVKAGYPLVTCAHTRRSPVDELVDEGAAEKSNPREVVESSDIVILCLPDHHAVVDVLNAPDGILFGLSAGKIVVDTGTTGLAVTRECVSAVEELGAEWIDAPISGGIWGAQAGTLTFMVGGNEQAVEQVRSILESMGDLIVHVGSSGAGQVTKLVNNLMASISTVAVSEAFSLGVKAGVDVKALFEVVTHSSGNNWVLGNAAPLTIFAGDYQPGGRLKTMLKDLRLTQEVARDMGAPLLLGDLVGGLYTLMVSKGHGEEDADVVARFYEDILGISLVSPEFQKEKDAGNG